MKKLLRVLCVSFLGLAALSCYDDSKIWETMEDYEARLAELETLCSTMNTNISSLQTLVEAVQSSDNITKVEPLTEDGKDVGYTITFAKFGTVKIYNGTNGTDGVDGVNGSTPVIGVKQDTDKELYWTIDGEWLTDKDGKKVKATGSNGADGEDGSMPTLKIENNYWYVSYDGRTWTKLDKATGEDGQDGKNGKDGNNGIFQKVYPEGGYLFFVLADNTVYKVPLDASALPAASSLDIKFDVEQGVKMVPGATYKVKYTVTGGNQNTVVRVGTCEGSPVIAAVKPESETSGYIYVHIKKWFDGSYDSDRNESNYDQHDYDDTLDEITQEEVYHSRMYLMVSVSDGGNNVINKTLNINEGVVENLTDTYLNEPTAGQATVSVRTNVNYQVYIPEDADWVSYNPTRSDLRTDELTFSLQANNTDKTRFAEIHLLNDSGSTVESFTVAQKSGKWYDAIEFADPEMGRLCLEAYDWNGDGVFTYGEAYEVTDLWTLRWSDKSNVTSFDELQYFGSVTEIPNRFFEYCSNLQSIKLPSSLIEISSHAFEGTSIGETLEIPALVEYIYIDAFYNCWNLKSVKMLGTEPCYVDNAFDLHTIISVPDGCYDAYKNQWVAYNFAEKSLYIETYSSNSGWQKYGLNKGEDGLYTAEIQVEAGSQWYLYFDNGYVIGLYDTYIHPDIEYSLSRSYNSSYFPGTGTVTVYVSDDLQRFWYEGDMEIVRHWYLVGAFNNWTPGDSTYKITKDGEWIVYEGFATTGTELKFVDGSGWTINRGGTFTEAGGEMYLSQDGANIVVPAGTYDIYINEEGTVAKFVVSENLIAIDGQFSDWELIDASKISVATCDPDTRYTALKTVKVYADAKYINVYFEFEGDEINDRSWVPFHVFLDSDNNSSTGGYYQWSDCCSDHMLESCILCDGDFYSYDPSVFKWWGPDGDGGWEWTDPNIGHSADDNYGALIGEGSGVARGAGSGNRYELAIKIDMLEGVGINLADTFGIGVDIQQSWSSVGVLPNAACTDDNPYGTAPMLKVNINR